MLKHTLVGLLAALPLLTAVPALHAAENAPYVISEAEYVEMAKNIERFNSAIIRGDSREVKRLLNLGITPNIVLENGDTPLTYALRSDAWKVADVLMAHEGIDINLENAHGETPLMLAVFKGREETFEALIKAGASVNKERGWTPLHYAATEAQIDLMKRLIELGANVNAQTKAGVTPLAMAARRPNREAAQILLRAGAYRDYCTDRGMSPADFAKKAGDEKLAQFLEIPKCAVMGPADSKQYAKPASKTPTLFQ